MNYGGKRLDWLVQTEAVQTESGIIPVTEYRNRPLLACRTRKQQYCRINGLVGEQNCDMMQEKTLYLRNSG